MKNIIKFKENIFEKIDILPFAPEIVISENLTTIIKLKNDLAEIKKKFGNHESREIILLHKRNLPPKSKRCFDEIINMDRKRIKYSTSRFVDFDSENVKLEILFNFDNKALENAISYVNNVISLCRLIQKMGYKLSIIKDKSSKIPLEISDFLKKWNMKKTKIAKFIANIQGHYEKLFIKSEKLTGEFILSFSSKKMKDNFVENNDINILKNISETQIIIKSKTEFETANIIKIDKNFKIDKIDSISESGGYIPKLKKIDNDLPIIGVLDSKIPNESPFKNLIKVTSYLDENEVIHHGEAVSSIAFAGDKINNFDDGCGHFNIHLFEIFENGLNYSKLIERIKMAIENNSHIKVWNLSINQENMEAFEDGKITSFAAFLDEIQLRNKVLIIQSAGNKNAGFQKVMAPSDAIKSLVVNATKTIKNQNPTSYSLNESSAYYTKKPDVSFFGGSEEQKVIALKNSKTIKVSGTSFATPFVARKAAHLIYYEGYSILEAKAMIIHAAYVNSFDNQNQKNGWGVVPKHIDEITNSKDSHIRFVFKEKISNTKSSFMKLKIPQQNQQEYSILMTVLSSERVDQKYGCEYVRSSVNVNMGPLDDNNDFINHKKLKPTIIADDSGEPIAHEKKLIKEYSKWKLTNCLEDIIKRERIGIYNYGISAKIDKRMSEIKDHSINHDMICIVTLIHKDDKDKYKEFIKVNANNIINVESKIEGNINIKDLK